MGIDYYDTITTLILEGREKIGEKEIQTKGLIPFLGASGSGKSTCINYLYGCHMTLQTDPETGVTTIQAENPVMKIGSEALSETLYPQIARPEGEEFSFLDCPGFQDNRGDDYILAGAVILQDCIRRAGSIKGFVIVIDYYALADSRNVILNETAQALYEMLPSYPSIPDNILFLITKAPAGIDRKQLSSTLDRLAEEVPNHHLKRLMKLMQGHKENVILCDPLNAGEIPSILNKIRGFASDFDAQKVGLGLTNHCKVRLYQVTEQKAKSLNQLLRRYYKNFEVEYREQIAKAASVKELEFLEGQLFPLDGLPEQIDQYANFMKFLILSATGTRELYDLTMKEADVLFELLSYTATDSPSLSIDSSVRRRILEIIADLKALCREKNRALAQENLYQSLAEPRFRKTLISIPVSVLENPENLNDWIDKQKEKDFKDQLTQLVENTGKEETTRILSYLVRDAIQVKWPIKDGKLTLKIEAPCVLMSEIADVAGLYLKEDVHTLLVVGAGTIVADCDLGPEGFSGKNVVLIGRELICEEEHMIDVSAMAGENAPAEMPASDTQNEMNGGSGKNGGDAGYSGDILLSFAHVSHIDKLLLKANGGNGGDGQPGGDGIIGATGADGQDANFNSETEELSSKYTLLKGAIGDIGGNGGNGGNGGDGGKGSVAGNIFLFGAAKQSLHDISQVSGRNGLGGKCGKKGGKGPGGKGGHHGLKVTITTYIQGMIYPLKDINYYFKNGTSGEKRNLISDDGSKFQKIWDEDSDLRSKMENSMFAKDGAQGVSEGIDGQDGESLSEDQIQKSDHSIDLFHFIDDLCTNYAFSFVNWKQNLDILFESGLLDSATLSCDLAFAVLTSVENQELRLHGTDRETMFYQTASAIYRKLEQQILKKETLQEADWQFLAFAVSEKGNYYEERLNGNRMSGNRIMNLELLNRHIEETLKDSAEIARSQKKQKYFQEYQQGISDKIHSGKDEVQKLLELSKQYMEGTKDNIASILKEIQDLKDKTDNSIEALKAKKEQLKKETENSILQSILTTTFGTLTSILGLAFTWNNISQSLMMNKASQAEVGQTINELTVRASIEPLQLEGYDGAEGFELENLSHDTDQFQFELLNSLPPVVTDRLRDQYGEDFNWVLGMEKCKYNQSSPNPGVRLVGDDKVKEIRHALALEEINYLDTSKNSMVSTIKKKTAEGCERRLKQQASIYRGQRMIQTVSTMLNISSNIFNCVENCSKYRSSSEQQEKEIEAAIMDARDQICKLDHLNTEVNNLQQDYLENDLRPFLESIPQIMDGKDTFSVSSAILNLKLKMGQLLEIIKKIKFESAGGLQSSIEKISMIIETQMEIFDKINVQKDQLNMGALIYHLTDEEGVSLTEAHKAFAKKLLVTRLQYLSQLETNAFLLWSFPFGYQALQAFINRDYEILSNDDEETAKAKARFQNQAIRTWLMEDRYTWAKKHNYILRKAICKDSCYASVPLRNQNENYRTLLFLTGEKITVSLPPNEAMDAVKYVTIYADIPALKQRFLNEGKRREVYIHMDFTGDCQFRIHNNITKKTSVYGFHQDEIRITHSLYVYMKDNRSNKAEDIWADGEDEGIAHFKDQSLDTGRSPYSQCTIWLSMDEWNRTFSWDRVGSHLEQAFQDLYPGSGEREKERIQADMEKAMISEKWLEYDGEGKPTIAPWSVIAPSTAMEEQPFSPAQANWMKKALLEQIMITDSSILDEDLKICFIGFGTYLNRSRVSANYQIPSMYDAYLEKTQEI